MTDEAKPVAWIHHCKGMPDILAVKPLTRGAEELGWTETPLYTRPTPPADSAMVEAMALWERADRAGEDAYVEAVQIGVESADDAHKCGAIAAAAVIAEALAAKDAELAELRAEIEALRGDKARLDYLDECNRRLNTKYGTSYGWKLIINHNVNRLMLDSPSGMQVNLHDSEAGNTKLPSCRKAIDECLNSYRAALGSAEG